MRLNAVEPGMSDTPLLPIDDSEPDDVEAGRGPQEATDADR